jgi:hypothetical protein
LVCAEEARSVFVDARAKRTAPRAAGNPGGQTMRHAGFGKITLREFHGGHELSREELRGVVEWWLRSR